MATQKPKNHTQMNTSILRTLLLSLIAALTATITCTARPTTVYMLRLDQEIGSATWRYTQQALDQARRQHPDILLIHLNTYGGSVQHADSIRTALLQYPGPTIGWVDNNAASAGALIALACDTLYMRPGSSMGAATVVSGTDGTAMPDKYQSYMRAMMRSTAEHHGKTTNPDSTLRWRRDPQIAQAMVDPRITVKDLIDSTQVLTFSPDEAIRWHYADGKADTTADLMAQLGITQYTLTEYHPTLTDRLIGFLTSPAVQAILIMIMLGGIWMELQSPGVGFPTAAAIIAAVLYFLPLLLGGIASTWIALIFVAGLILIVMEMFVVPGFGITGITGIACICTAIIIGLIEHYTYSLTWARADTLWQAIAIFISGLLGAIATIAWLTSRHGPKWARRHTQLTLTQQTSEGYIGVDMTPAAYIGFEGTATTDMRPAGKVMVCGIEMDAVSMRGYIYAGDRVRIEKYENAQIYVRPIN